jgi:hypothetical protein
MGFNLAFKGLSLQFVHYITRGPGSSVAIPTELPGLSTFVLTRTNIRNVFYYKISEHAPCPQQVELLLTQSI